MIDFFHKGASMTKRVTGTARIAGAPKVNARPARLPISKIGTFYDGEKRLGSLLLEVADSEDGRKRGLMGRADMPDICGMLFEGLSGGGYFWMKDCLIPLDVAFMDDSGVVSKIYTMELDPDGDKHYGYGEDVMSAVEVRAGLLKEMGVSEGCTFKTRGIGGDGGDDV